MVDKVRIFINSRGKLEAFAVDPDDLYTIQVAVSEELENDLPFDPTEYHIQRRQKEAWSIISRCEVIGRLTEKRGDMITTKQYYKKWGAELTPLPLPSSEKLIELGFSGRK
jgi:hypothetical protein